MKNKKRSSLKTLLKMLSLVKPLSPFMCLAIFCGTVAYFAVQFIPILGSYGVMLILEKNADFSSKLHLIFISLIILALVRSVFRYAEQKTNHYIAFTLLALVRDKVFKALRRLSPAKLESRDKGDLISLITSDVELLEVFYAHTISPIFIAIIVETVMTVFIARFSIWQGLLSLAAFLCVGVIVPFIISKVSGNTGEKIRAQSAELSGYMLENIRGLDETLQYDNGENRKNSMNEKTKKLSAAQKKLTNLNGTNLAIANTFILIFDIAMVILSIILLKNGIINNFALVIPTVALMSSFGPVVALSALGTTLQNTIASANRILDILEEIPETKDISQKIDVEFSGASSENVSFSYKNKLQNVDNQHDDKILNSFSMNFPENKIIGIVGKSGCGKSTLLKLLMRFWKTDSGQIKISGKNIEEINTKNLRELESYMTQETEIFKDTIANNIRIAKLDATQEEIENACKKASLHDFIMTLPNGYETNVGELGDTLSGGEKQRIGLARIFLHNAPFILLDEPTSNLDSLNEAVILRSLKNESKGKTIALVSHRESTVKIADEVFKME